MVLDKASTEKAFAARPGRAELRLRQPGTLPPRQSRASLAAAPRGNRSFSRSIHGDSQNRAGHRAVPLHPLTQGHRRRQIRRARTSAIERATMRPPRRDASKSLTACKTSAFPWVPLMTHVPRNAGRTRSFRGIRSPFRNLGNGRLFPASRSAARSSRDRPR